MMRNVVYFNIGLRTQVLSSFRGFRRNVSTKIPGGTGPHGVDGRGPLSLGVQNQQHNEIAITDPYIIYQSYIQQGILERDANQLRVMKEFQKLYYRVINYSPPEELLIKISLIIRQLELKEAERYAKEQAGSGMFFRFGHLQNLFRKEPEAEKKQIVRFMTDEEELINFPSPQGLLVNGEVGCGKSMLMDIFAGSLPHKSKMRWHYNNFILWVYNEMHSIQKERLYTSYLANGKGRQRMTMENEFVLFEIAQKMINKSTILMLDEFMLPDIASANIIKILFTYYFKLGGVLVATSNKLPEELYSNNFRRTNFKEFVKILNFRCQSIDMKSEKDYRTSFANNSETSPYIVVKLQNRDHERDWLRLIKTKALGFSPESELAKDKYTINDLGGKPSTITVYNRNTHIPLTFNDDTTCYLDFSHICQGRHSSSDYITLASKYKTVILDNVPVMTIKMKNEARRFITLLDAIYESRCQFFMRSDVDVDYIFFPDTVYDKLPDNVKTFIKENVNFERLEVQDEEMFAKTAIDLSTPYRPNVSSYDLGYASSFSEQTSSTPKEGSAPDQGKSVDFTDLKAFTGEDEKFAYKRAVLRIREMVGSEIWRKHMLWVPLDETMRPWESLNSSNAESSRRSFQLVFSPKNGDSELWKRANEDMDKFIEANENPSKIAENHLKHELPKDYSERNNIPFGLFNSRIAPVFHSIQHFWALGSWSPLNGRKLKDNIAKSWIRSSSKDDNK